MCETRPGMMIYHDIIPQLKLLSDEQCGKLLRALLRYSLHGLLSELDPMTEIVCIACRSRIDRDDKRYSDTVYKRRIAAEKRWRKENPDTPPPETHDYDAIARAYILEKRKHADAS
ncbi:MAG: hypothetical protein GX929_04820 [Clostridiales bacterium]|jgi:hypothetical protein|nr:hypothetical protein [Clostridiales bacterium]